MTPERIKRRGILQFGLGGIAALGPLPVLAQKSNRPWNRLPTKRVADAS